MHKTCGLNPSKSWYLWPDLGTFLVETIPRYAFPGRCPILNYQLYDCTYNKCRSSHSQMFIKMGVLKNFAIIARKHLWWILFLINLFNKKPILKNIWLLLKFNESVFWSWNIISLILLRKTCIRTYTVVTRLKDVKA